MNAENEEWLRTNPHTLTQSSTTDKKKQKKKTTVSVQSYPHKRTLA